ncbi:Tnf receptor-associated factor-like protein [Thalictrum thalictroides]|uniref:Tnf receptor-associated factor-like protein n=1 Tax=Thalictrum thalictroides TaxID=46969 RepID=A0A7J6WR56_THATH|nr:Tnf receptor-associated factor-like protein [Thalictrum thalictroides]
MQDSSGGEFNKDSIQRDERRLTELGRRTVEIFVLAHIFSNKIEVAYQEAVALKRQEELIREEEAAGQADCEQKAKRAGTEKEKRAKKKQSKNKRTNRKGKDKGKDENSNVTIQDKAFTGNTTSVDVAVNLVESVPYKPDAVYDISDISDTGDDVSETLQLESEDRDTGTVNWDTDTSEFHLTEPSGSAINGLPLQDGKAEKKSTYFMDDSSSTCSTDSVPSRIGNKVQTSPSRGNNQCGKDTEDCTTTVRAHDIVNQCSEPVVQAGCQRDTPQIKCLQQHLVEKEEEVVTLQKKLDVKDLVDVERPNKQNMVVETLSSLSCLTINPPSAVKPKVVAERTVPEESVLSKEISSNSLQKMGKTTPTRTSSPQVPSFSKKDVQSPAKSAFTHTEKNTAYHAVVMSRPSSAPLVPVPRSSAPVVSTVQTAPSLERSVSASGRLDNDRSSATQSHVNHSYKNAIMGKTMGAGSVDYTPSRSTENPSSVCSQPSYLVSSPLLSPECYTSHNQGSGRSNVTFGSVSQDVLHCKLPWTGECSQPGTSNTNRDPSLLSNIPNLDIFDRARTGLRTHFADELPPNVSSRQAQSSTEDFPHLDIINYLLDEEHNTGRAAMTNAVHSPYNGHHHSLNRQFSFSDDVAISAGMSPSINCGSYDRVSNYHYHGMHQVYGSPFDVSRDVHPLAGLSSYASGCMDRGLYNRWPTNGGPITMLNTLAAEDDGYRYQLPDYAMASGVNGYSMYQPSNGL